MNELPLKDIHLPETSWWWPPAPGWWIVLALLLLAAFYAPSLIRWLRWKPVKAYALAELERLREGFENGLDEKQLRLEISALLRRTLISYCGRAATASISGDKWVEQLRQVSGKDCFDDEQNQWLSSGQYAPVADCDPSSLIRSCENWIEALPRRSADAAN